MTEKVKRKVENTRVYLLQSSIPEDTKDGLSNLLDFASDAANGSQDKITAMADALLALSLHEVRQAIRAPEAIKQAIADHLDACPLAGDGKRGAAMALLLRPWPWIFFSVAAFSPNFPAILGSVKEFLH